MTNSLRRYIDVVAEAFDPHKIIADLERMASHPNTEKPLADESRRKADELRSKYNIPHGTSAPQKANVGRYYAPWDERSPENKSYKDENKRKATDFASQVAKRTWHFKHENGNIGKIYDIGNKESPSFVTHHNDADLIFHDSLDAAMSHMHQYGYIETR